MNEQFNLRQFAKLAIDIHERLLQQQEPQPAYQALDFGWQCLQTERRRLDLAAKNGLLHAKVVQYDRVRLALTTMQTDLQAAIGYFHAPANAPVASPREILNDLVALHDDFDGVAFVPERSVLSVVTPAVTLEDLYLGPFRIELDVECLTPHPRYQVVAEDPQRSERSPSVTHPHVDDDCLCEGEGTMPIRAAMRSGHLLEFFLIVNNLLHTYNSASPYVSISDWNGAVCRECDATMDRESCYDCERCEIALCGECSRFCGDCSATVCSRCSRECCRCGEDVCRGCATECGDCGEPVCPHCTQDDRRCPTCHEIHLDQTEDQSTDSALQSVCMGEAAVSAGSG